MNIVNLDTAFAWTCHCGHRNYVEAIPCSNPAVDEELRADAGALAEAMHDDFELMKMRESGFEPSGSYVLAPDVVQCAACGAKSTTDDGGDQ